VIGLEAHELAAVRQLVALLRHPDPSIGELARQALVYLEDISARNAMPQQPETLGHAG
jgi:hypothetical protein